MLESSVSSLVEDNNFASITEAEERVIMALIEHDCTQKEAGPLLHLSTRTVNSHMGNARNRFGVKGNISLIIRLLREGQIEVPGLVATDPII